MRLFSVLVKTATASIMTADKMLSPTKKVEDIIGIGKGKIHRKYADDCRSDAIAIPVGFQRDQKHAEHKDHGYQRLHGKELLNPQIDVKRATKNKDRK